MEKKNLCGLSPDEIILRSDIHGFTLPDATAVANSVYKKRLRNITDFPKISLKLKKKLSELYTPGLYSPESSVKSDDGTIKYLFRNNKGLVFETVFMTDKKRNTVCVSSQSGCRMGCRFCATGSSGFRGNLTAGDIVNQVISLPESGSVNHVVFMGMGEPFDNSDNVMKAISVLTAQWGAAISPRDITVSTVGIIPEIEKFLKNSACNLTFSLFSPFTDERIISVPSEKTNPAADIIDIIKKFPVRKKRRMSVGYVMIKGNNDSERHLTGLKDLLQGSAVRVNLIPYHPVPRDRNIASDNITMMHFKHELVISGISASIRRSRGADISAACGLLASGSGHEFTSWNKYSSI